MFLYFLTPFPSESGHPGTLACRACRGEGGIGKQAAGFATDGVEQDLEDVLASAVDVIRRVVDQV